MASKYKIHPAVGIARVGNSPTEFYIGPEQLGALPIDVDANGRIPLTDGAEQPVTSFRDAEGRVKRQAARFRVWIYDEQNPEGRPIKVGEPSKGEGGDTIQGVGSKGRLTDIIWTVYLANKKACWYRFQELNGEYGYAPGHPLRNADIQGDARMQLIIDPGPQSVSGTGARAELARGKNPYYAAQTFPPPLSPSSIDSLGEVRTYDDHSLFVLGGFGNSGSMNDGFGSPSIQEYANNDGWFDDIADGPVVATLQYWDDVDAMYRYVQADGAWTLVGYPRYVPEMPDLVTLDDCVYDLFVREFDFNPYLYGPATRQQARQNAFPLPGDPPKQYNENYFPYWDTEIYPILSRPFLYGWTVAALGQADPHETGPGGMALDMSKISLPPKDGADPYLQMRQFVYRILRKIGQENRLTLTTPVNAPGVAPLEIPMMPLLNGDNPLTNEIVSKFFTLTETQLFILKQWADGKFIPGNLPNGSTPIGPSMPPGVAIDRGVLGNALGGSFCPGGEVTWIIRNPEIWASPYRIRHARDFGPNQTAESTGDTNGINYFNSNAQLSLGDNPSGFEPGDLTKRSALPWQSDFNECTTNSTDVTFENANVNYLPPDQQLTYGVIWWPAHRPLQVFVPSDPANPATSGSAQRDWASPIPETNIGDAMMVSLWNQLGFVRNYGSYASPNFVEIERLLPRPGGI